MHTKDAYCLYDVSGSLHISCVYQDIVAGKVIPDKGSGHIPPVTVADSAFLKHSWLINVYTDQTTNPQELFFYKKLCSLRIVMENATFFTQCYAKKL